MADKVNFIEQKTAKNGKSYLRIGLEGKGFYTCFDQPSPTVSKGDEIEFESMDSGKSLLSGIRVVGKSSSGSSSSYRRDDAPAHLPFVSYAKDLLLAELSPADSASSAAAIVCRLMEEFGADRKASMLVSYAKDLICGGWKMEDAVQAVRDIETDVIAQIQFGENA